MSATWPEAITDDRRGNDQPGTTPATTAVARQQTNAALRDVVAQREHLPTDAPTLECVTLQCHCTYRTAPGCTRLRLRHPFFATAHTRCHPTDTSMALSAGSSLIHSLLSRRPRPGSRPVPTRSLWLPFLVIHLSIGNLILAGRCAAERSMQEDGVRRLNTRSHNSPTRRWHHHARWLHPRWPKANFIAARGIAPGIARARKQQGNLNVDAATDVCAHPRWLKANLNLSWGTRRHSPQGPNSRPLPARTVSRYPVWPMKPSFARDRHTKGVISGVQWLAYVPPPIPHEVPSSAYGSRPE